MGEVVKLEQVEQTTQEPKKERNEFNGHKAEYLEQATEIIQFMNGKTGFHYRPKTPRGEPTSGAVLVMRRLAEGYTVEDCKAVIAVKCREWLHDDKMHNYCRPATLFARTNFESYMGQLEQ